MYKRQGQRVGAVVVGAVGGAVVLVRTELVPLALLAVVERGVAGFALLRLPLQRSGGVAGHVEQDIAAGHDLALVVIDGAGEMEGKLCYAPNFALSFKKSFHHLKKNSATL